MENRIITRWSKSILTSAARTTSSSATFALPHDALDACFVLDITAGATGTTPTLTVDIETSPDNGTTYYPVFRFAQVTTTKSIQRMICTFNAGGQNTATTSTNANGGNNIAVTNSSSSRTLLTTSFSSGCPIVPDYMGVHWYISGSSATYTFVMWAWGNSVGRGLVCP